MVWIIPNTVINRWTFNIYLAFSKPSLNFHREPGHRLPKRDPDEWAVRTLPPGTQSSGIDVDYIRAAEPGTALQFQQRRTHKVIFTSYAPEWVKIRQLSHTEIISLPDPKIGRLMHDSLLQAPAPALVESKKYDKGMPGEDEIDGRGTEAVQRAIDEWERRIAAGEAKMRSMPSWVPSFP